MTANRQPTNISHDKHDTTPCTQLVRPVPHEFAGHLHYMDGLDPWHACCERLGIDVDTDLDATTIAPIETTATYAGQRWTVTLTPKRSGLTPEQVDPLMVSIPEFVIQVENADYAGNAPPKASYRISPRTPDTSGPNWTGINVAVDGSNLNPEMYPQLLDAATAALGIDADLSLEAAAESSNITTFEQYVRIRSVDARVLYGDDGPFCRIAEHVATTSDYRKLEVDRRDERSFRDVVGFGSTSAGTLIDKHELGKEIKLYDAATPPNDEEHPLHHPKLGVRYVGKHTDDSVYWSDLDAVEHELNELLINVLYWSGISLLPASTDVSAGRSSYVGDEHFDPAASLSTTFNNRGIRVIEDPLPEIRRRQRNAVDVAYTETTETEREALEVIADGGYMTEPNGPGMHYETVAERAGCSVATVYRLLEKFEGALQNTAGRIKMASQTITKGVRSWCSRPSDQSNESVTQSSAEASADYGGSVPDGSKMSAVGPMTSWKEWAAEHGVKVRQDYERRQKNGPKDGPVQYNVIDLGELQAGWSSDDLRQHIETGFEAWKASNRPEESYRIAKFRWREYGADETNDYIGMYLPGVTLEADHDLGPQLKSLRR